MYEYYIVWGISLTLDLTSSLELLYTWKNLSDSQCILLKYFNNDSIDNLVDPSEAVHNKEMHKKAFT